ncbi:uncharacterized aarF domain-containing protein kinase 2-like isoform X2 [Odontomachus brunneus]|uniref:uncharacterized aarF domain-containing protein kinase 2-like isoform X2 n=1 Tax=Odontomachus brunneus TaxID=486640 RepID=UPI0013F21912|nr:uncharacterized aarF domain-containing protein kinase 2-like isoform X2 [Odontomachus brunneus]
MSLRPNLVRFFRQSSSRLSRRYRGDIIANLRKWHRPMVTTSHFRPLITRRLDLDLAHGVVGGVRHLASTLSRVQPAVKIEVNALWPIEREETEEIGLDAREAILILARIMVISSVISTLLAAYLITRLTHATSFSTILRKAVEFLGPIFVKFGQWVSTRRDIFPRDVCDSLSQLQQNVTPHSWLYTKRLLKATYGSSWRNLFVKFDDEGPIGSGCCAQVYKAWIDLNEIAGITVAGANPQVSRFVENEAPNENDENDKVAPAGPARKLQAVAVKVLHPGIKGQLKRDIAIMRGLCKCATYFIPELHWLSLTDCIDEFARIMQDQVDMRLEAANLARFSANFSRRRDVVFPYPYVHLTRRGILVETFHEGSPISDYLEHDDATFQRKLAKIGIATVLKMLFQDNFIHCDLHPGNILVEKAVVPKAGLFSIIRRVITPNYVADGPRLIILDCGLVASLSDRCRRNLRDVFHSVLMGNGEMAAQYILEHNSYTTPDSDGFKRAMKNIVKAHYGRPLNVSVSTVVTELFSAMIRHRVKQDASFSNVILSVLVVESLGRHLDPKIDIFAEILPFVVNSAIYGV